MQGHLRSHQKRLFRHNLHVSKCKKCCESARGLMLLECTPRQGETWRESRWQGHMGSPHQLCFSHLFAMLCTFLRVCDGAWSGCDRKGHQSKEERKKEDSRRKASRGQTQSATLLAFGVPACFQNPCASPIALCQSEASVDVH